MMPSDQLQKVRPLPHARYIFVNANQGTTGIDAVGAQHSAVDAQQDITV